MKKNFVKSLFVIILSCLLFLLSGCHVYVSKKGSSISGLPEKNNVAEIAMDNLTADMTDYKLIEIKKNAELQSKDSKRLIAIFDFGELTIHPTDNENIEVRYYLGHDEELNKEQKDYFDKISLKMVEQNNMILIETILPDGFNARLFNKNSERTALIMDIGLPKHIQELAVSNNVGMTKIKDIEAEIRLVNNVGVVQLEDITPLNSTYCLTNVGELTYKIKDASKVYEIYGMSNVGSLNLTLPKGATYNHNQYNEESEFGDTVRETIENSIGETAEEIFTEWEKVEDKSTLNIYTVSNIGSAKIEN